VDIYFELDGYFKILIYMGF